MSKVYMVSGHTDLTQEEYDLHYKFNVTNAINNGCKIITGGAQGADRLTQELCKSSDYFNLTVYDKGAQDNRIDERFNHINGFASYILRDEHMTSVSDVDIAYVRPNTMALGSGTKCNIHRRLYGIPTAIRLMNELRNMNTEGSSYQDMLFHIASTTQ